MRLKLLLFPRTVISKHDGDSHYIGVPQLMELYTARPDDEVAVFNDKNPTMRDSEAIKRHYPNHFHLHVREDGSYFDIHKYAESLENAELLINTNK